MQNGEIVHVQMKHISKEKNNASTQAAGVISLSPTTGTWWAGASPPQHSSSTSYKYIGCKYSPVNPTGLFFPGLCLYFSAMQTRCIFCN